MMMHKIETFIKEMNDDNLWILFAKSRIELRERGLARTGNITSERGEYLVLEHYKNKPGLPKLQLAPPSTKNIDAISTGGERYSIKTIVYPNRTTGVFYGLNPPKSKEKQRRLFEYVIITTIDEEFQLLEIIEIDWSTFLKFKKWHKRMNAWNLTLTGGLRAQSRIVFSKEKFASKK